MNITYQHPDVECTEFTLYNSNNDAITGNVRFPKQMQNNSALPVVVVLHGFKAFKDWGFFGYVCAELALHGAIVVNFNYSLNGFDYHSDGSVTNTEKFARNTITQELLDSEIVLTAITNKTILPNHITWNNNIYALGHSRGAGLALLTAVRNQRISKAVLLAPVSTYNRHTARQQQQWRERGYFEVLNTRTNELLRQNVSYLNDIEQHAQEYSLTAAIASLTIPVRIIVGEQDMTTPLRESDQLIQHDANTITSRITIPKTGHTFGAVHPFAGTTEALETVITETSLFFEL
ncbi:MAG: alpha/beta fold hydrolase [Candidatus Kapaibacterium sp.]